MSSGKRKSSRRSRSALLLEFLGSMNLAITLLVMVGIASIVGTVLKQNEPFQNYVFKFGPFWFEVFDALGLYDVYSAVWFLLILAFLVLSTSTCIYRNVPQMWKEIRSYRLGVRFDSLNAFHCRHQWQLQASPDAVISRLEPVAGAFRFRTREKRFDDHRLVAAKKGTINRLGYLFTHSAIVIICIGGLLDGNLPLKWRAYTGDITIETRDIPASEVPNESRLAVTNPSFRGSVNVPEGASANILFLNLRDGYLVQPLPFTIEVRDFRIEHYSSGQPKSFESDLVIHDDTLDAPLEQTIAVNHPLIHRGYAIYQASFSDGGTKLDLKLWPLLGREGSPQQVKSAVFENLQLDTSLGSLTLELDNFRLFNINPINDPEAEKEFRNFGPNYTFKLRNETGEAMEFENYMLPVEMEGRMFYLSGVRREVSDPFQYLYVPAAPGGGIERFMEFNTRLHDPVRLQRVAENTANQSLQQSGLEQPGFASELTESMVQLLTLFASQGFDGIGAHVNRTVPEAERANVLEAYLKVLQTMLAALYAELLTDGGVDFSDGVTEADSLFFDDAVNAIGALGNYGAPLFVQLENFEHIQSTGLQIARAPGKTLVYFGFALLIAGVFCMFYVPAQRLWFWVDEADGATRVLFAGSGHRHPREFNRLFERMRDVLDEQFKGL